MLALGKSSRKCLNIPITDVKVKKVKVLIAQSCPHSLLPLGTVVCQVPLCMEFSRQKYWGYMSRNAIAGSYGSSEETVETVSDFIFLGSKITADGDYSHEIKRRLLPWKESYDQPIPYSKEETLLCQLRSV